MTDIPCPNGGYHYEDLSCCHTQVPNAVALDLVVLLRGMVANDYPNGNEWAGYQDRIRAVLNELPDPGPVVVNEPVAPATPGVPLDARGRTIAAEGFLVQVWSDTEERWMDYARGTVNEARRFLRNPPADAKWRCVDWLLKEPIEL